jgi:hypothetical protein
MRLARGCSSPSWSNQFQVRLNCFSKILEYNLLNVQFIKALLFTLAGAYQMMVWAQGKHRNYRREFEKYPRGRKAIFPFLV